MGKKTMRIQSLDELLGLEPEETLLTGTADISGNSGNRVTD